MATSVCRDTVLRITGGGAFGWGPGEWIAEPRHHLGKAVTEPAHICRRGIPLTTRRRIPPVWVRHLWWQSLCPTAVASDRRCALAGRLTTCLPILKPSCNYDGNWHIQRSRGAWPDDTPPTDR